VGAWQKYAAENNIADEFLAMQNDQDFKTLQSHLQKQESAQPAVERKALDEARLAYARALLKKGDARQALERLSKVETHPADRDLLRTRAHLLLNDIPAAIISVKEAESHGADAVAMALAKARIHHQSKDNESAKKVLEAVLSTPLPLSADTGELALLYGRILFEEGQLDPVMRHARAAEKIKETRGEALRLQALVYHRGGNTDAYAEMMRLRAYALPANESAWTDFAYANLELGVARMKLNDRMGARKAIIEARLTAAELTELFPKTHTSWEAFARALLLLRQVEEKPSPDLEERARAAVKKQLECLNGDVNKLPADLRPFLEPIKRIGD
jgi:tetratricopeptide (TPR) repeat protein